MKNLLKALSKSLIHLQIININSTLFGTQEILDHSFKLSNVNTTTALFTKVIVPVVKTVSVNP